MRANFYRTRKLRKVALFSFVGTLMVSGFVTLPVAQAPQGHSWSLRGKAAGSTVSDDRITKKRIRLSQKEDPADSDHKKVDTREPDDKPAKLDSPKRTHSGIVRTHTTTQPQMSQPAKKKNRTKPGRTRSGPAPHLEEMSRFLTIQNPMTEPNRRTHPATSLNPSPPEMTPPLTRRSRRPRRTRIRNHPMKIRNRGTEIIPNLNAPSKSRVLGSRWNNAPPVQKSLVSPPGLRVFLYSLFLHLDKMDILIF